MYIPTYRELSKEQVDVLNLPEKGRFLVSGPPGTGKSVMVLKRAEAVNDSGMNPEIVMYGRPLRKYTDNTARNNNIKGDIKTYYSYLWRKYQKIFNGRIPQIEPYVHDWEKILEHVNRLDENRIRQLKSSNETLIIDEGQDMNKHFYLFASLLFENYTIFADENQRLNEENSLINEIKAYGQIVKEYFLTHNYRNTKQIAKLAREFHTGNTALPELPERNGKLPRFRYIDSFEDSINWIRTHERNFSSKPIGVFVVDTAQQNRVYKALKKKTVNNVEYYNYKTKDSNMPDMTSPGIKIITYESAKGLEFETVFIPEINKYSDRKDKIYTKMKLYVLITRARENLFITFNQSTGSNQVIEDLFPNKESGLIKYI